MEWNTLVELLMGVGGPLAEHFHSLSTGDMVTSTLAVLSFCYAIYLKWKTAESRINQRLLDHLSNEENRLHGVRNSLADQLMRHNPSLIDHLPNALPPLETRRAIYTNRDLEKALKKLNWKKPEKTQKQLEKVLQQVDHRVAAASKSTDVHKKQKAAAHLMLGAIAASRNDNWEEALAEFEAVLELNPNDAEALEYAGFQLLKMGSKQRAIHYFQRLQEVAEQEQDMVLYGRACRHESYAFGMEPNPRLGHARSALDRALEIIPRSELFERAITYELIGNLQKQAGHTAAATDSYTKALVRYNRLGNKLEGREGQQRMTQAISNVNQISIADGVGDGNENSLQNQNTLHDSQQQVLYQMGPTANETTESSTETSPNQDRTQIQTPETPLTN